VELVAHKDAQSFLEAAGPVLLRDEARHNLMFGICSTLTEAPDAYSSFHLRIVSSDGEPLLAMLMTPPFNLLVGQPVDPAAVQFAAATLMEQSVVLPGVTGALPQVDAFAEYWRRLSGASRRLRMAQGIYAVRTVRPPRAVEGRMRLASKEDRPLVVEWFKAFAAESLPEGAPHQPAEDAVDRRFSSSGGFALWEDDEVVSLSGFGGQTLTGSGSDPSTRHRRYVAEATRARWSRSSAGNCWTVDVTIAFCTPTWRTRPPIASTWRSATSSCANPRTTPFSRRRTHERRS
jgi:uncharacterized protein